MKPQPKPEIAWRSDSLRIVITHRAGKEVLVLEVACGKDSMGEPIWKIARKVGASFGDPLPIDHADMLIRALAEKAEMDEHQ